MGLGFVPVFAGGHGLSVASTSLKERKEEKGGRGEREGEGKTQGRADERVSQPDPFQLPCLPSFVFGQNTASLAKGTAKLESLVREHQGGGL